MAHITFHYAYAKNIIRNEELEALDPYIQKAHQMLHTKTGQGNDFLGWLDLPETQDEKEYDRIQKAAAKIRSDSDVLLVIGIGGSYIGAKAAIDMLTHHFSHLKDGSAKAPQIIFAGHHLDAAYISDLFDVLVDRDISINVISKSGTTTEPAIAFRLFRSFMEEKYGRKEARERIYATTDHRKGALRQLATEEGYETFVIPDDVGGRFSVLTAVGLLPIAAAGISTDSMMKGASDAMHELKEITLAHNDSYQYAAVRNILYRKGKTIEMLIHYDPSLASAAEWWKQLFGESEGKDQKGIFPASAQFTTDLHSLGQYIQDGRRDLFETILQVQRSAKDISFPVESNNLDGLNYLADTSLEAIGYQAQQGTMLAHADGGVPNLVITLPSRDAYTFGYLVYFFEKSCAISGYLLGVNPFNQPGVEAYKQNMFALLGKEGFEKERELLKQRLVNNTFQP